MPKIINLIAIFLSIYLKVIIMCLFIMIHENNFEINENFGKINSSYKSEENFILKKHSIFRLNKKSDISEYQRRE